MSSSDSQSDSSQTQIQQTDDNRITAASGSTNLTMSRSEVGGNVNVTNTDYGSVGKSFDFANGTVGKAFDFAEAANQQSLSLIGGTVGKAFDFAKVLESGAADERAASGALVGKLAMSAMDSVKSAYATSESSVSNAYKDTADTLAAAYQTSKAGEQKVMVAVGLVVVGIVAIKVMGKA